MDTFGDRAAHRPGGPYRRPGAAAPRRFARAAPTEDLIQVYYPHLRDTVELLQVRRVLRRVNRFLRLIHRGDSAVGVDGHAIDAARALLDELDDMPPIEGELESAFPIEPGSGWLEGALGAGAVAVPDWERQYRHLEVLWRGLCEHHPIKLVSGSRHLRCGELRVGPTELAGTEARDTAAYGRMQPFTIGLRSQVAGDEILIECESTVGLVDLQDDAVVDALTDALDGGGAVKLCVVPRVGKHQDRICVRRDILFDPDATRLADVRAMFGNTLFPAVRLHAALEDAGLLGTSVD